MDVPFLRSVKIPVQTPLLKMILAPNGRHAAAISEPFGNRIVHIFALDGSGSQRRIERQDISIHGIERSLSFTPDSERLAVVHGLGEVRFYSVYTAEQVGSLRVGKTGQYLCFFILNDGEHIVLAQGWDMVSMWSMTKGRKVLDFQSVNGYTDKMVVTDDGRFLVILSMGAGVDVFSTKTGECLKRLGGAEELVVTRDNKCVLTTSIVEMDTRGCTSSVDGTDDARLLLDDERFGRCKCSEVSSDCRYLLRSYEFEPRIHVWSLETGQHVGVLEGSGYRTVSFFFSTDSRYVISKHRGSIAVWEVDSWRRVMDIDERYRLIVGTKDTNQFVATSRGKGKREHCIEIWYSTLYFARHELEDVNRLLSVAQTMTQGEEEGVSLIEMATLAFLVESASVTINDVCL